MCVLNETPLKQTVHKLGEINKNKRVWIANTDILKSFPIGEPVHINYSHEKGEITVEKAELLSNHTISSRNGHTPILDIKNRNVEETFPGIEKIEVLYYKNKLVIRATKNELARKERLANSGKEKLNLFEIFSGYGTMSYHLTRNKDIVSLGGLDISGKYLTMFEENANEEILTIQSALEDIHPSDLPKDISILSCGIPCTNFTPANLALNKAKRKHIEGVASDDDMKRIDGVLTAEALSFYILELVRYHNINSLVIEEVVKFSETSSADMIRSVLKQMKYHITETIVTSRHSKRKRWVLVANANKAVNLDNLDIDDGKTIGDLLDTPLDKREWKSSKEHKRVSGMIRKGLGIRATLPSEVRCGTFTQNPTTHTFPTLKHPTEDLYSDFTAEDIRNIHGLQGFKLSEKKTLNYFGLGQGTTEVFQEIGNRIVEAHRNN